MNITRKRISLILGTRPEAIKLCPLITALKACAKYEVHVCLTGQHREMLASVLDVFDVKPDTDLALMHPNQTLASLTSRAMDLIDAYLAETCPDMVVVQGDTTTALCAALCAFYRKIPVGHVEAGLRTRDRRAPFPEETNRTFISHLADLHFAPTEIAKENLVREGVRGSQISVTGNTVVDALMIALEKLENNPRQLANLPKLNHAPDAPIVLVTGHRRESFGPQFEAICRALAELAHRFAEVLFVYPVHLNPNVHEPAHRILGGIPNLLLVEPLDYLTFVALMRRATLVLTDSGGVQEEAPYLGKLVLVMRDTTERPEAIQIGAAKLVGTDCDVIVENVANVLTGKREPAERLCNTQPFGDGSACERIVESINRFWQGV